MNNVDKYFTELIRVTFYPSDREMASKRIPKLLLGIFIIKSRQMNLLYAGVRHHLYGPWLT